MGKEGAEKAYEAARDRRVEEIMSAPVHRVDEEGTVEDVLNTMVRGRLRPGRTPDSARGGGG